MPRREADGGVTGNRIEEGELECCCCCCCCGAEADEFEVLHSFCSGSFLSISIAVSERS